MNALACELLGAVIEKRDDGASRIERDGQSWFRVAATPRTIMTSLGPRPTGVPVTVAAQAGHRRCRSTRAWVSTIT